MKVKCRGYATRPLVFIGLFLAFCSGCKPERPTYQGPLKPQALTTRGEENPILATLGGYEVTLAEAQAWLGELPVYARIRHQTPESKREFLEALLEFLAFTWAARRDGIDKDPQVVDGLKSQLVEEFLAQEVDHKVAAAGAPEEWVRTYYEEHKHEFIRPEQREIRQILITDARLAERIAFRARKRTNFQGADPIDEFVKLVEAYSQDEATRRRGGVVGRFPWVERGPSPLPKEVEQVAEGMRELFEVKGPVPSGQGFHILFVSKIFAPVEKSLEAARPEIVEKWIQQERRRLRQAYITELMKAVQVEIDEVVLARIAGGKKQE